MAEITEEIFEELLKEDNEGTNNLGRRERKKLETRKALESAAFKLFKKRGYDQTKIEDITDKVNVSSRTYFRYFDSKEAVLFGNWYSNVDLIAVFIKSRPQSEAPLTVLREFGMLYSRLAEGQKDRLFLIYELSLTSKTIGAYERQIIYPHIENVIAEALAERMGINEKKDIRPRLYAGLEILAIFNARNIWVESGGKRSLPEITKEVFDTFLNLDA